MNTHLQALNAFCRWLHEEGHQELVHLPLLKTEKKVIPTLTQTQIRQLVGFRPKEFAQRRVHTVACLLLDSGLRIDEALRLTPPARKYSVAKECRSRWADAALLDGCGAELVPAEQHLAHLMGERQPPLLLPLAVDCEQQVVEVDVRIQGVLSLTRTHPRERVLAAITEAHARQHFRYQTIRQLVERTPAHPRPTLRTDDPAIRPMTQYTLEDFLA